MGSCVSVHKNPESVMKVKVCFGGTKSDNSVLPSSQSKDNMKSQQIAAVDGDVAVVGLKSFPADFGSKDETFFDSKAWLDSDCDDDFYSVNGDFTPSRGNTSSRGNTPKHYKLSPGTPQISKPVFGYKTRDQKSETSSTTTDKRKRLSDLFQESAQDDLDNSDPQTAATTGSNTPLFSEASSVCTSESTPNGVLKPETSNNKNKMFKSVQCCLPRLVSIRGFNDNKKIMSPVHSRG